MLVNSSPGWSTRRYWRKDAIFRGLLVSSRVVLGSRLRIYDAMVSLYLSHDVMAIDTQFSVDAVGLCQVMRPYKAKVIFYLFFVLRYGESSSDFNNSKIWKESRKHDGKCTNGSDEAAKIRVEQQVTARNSLSS